MSQVLSEAPWGEDAVRSLLRGLRRPHTLRDSPLARALMSTYGVNEPVKAARCFVNDTFAHGGLIGTRLAEIVYRSDFDASAPLVTVAHQMGLSPRHFFRRRAEAIAALARHAASVAFAPPAPDRAIRHLAGSLARTDPETSEAIARLGPAPNGAHHSADPSERLLDLCNAARTCFVFGDPPAGRRIVRYVEAELSDRGLHAHAAIDFEVRYLRYLDSIHSGAISESLERAAALSGVGNVSSEQAARRYCAAAESAVRSGNAGVALRALALLERVTARSDVRGHAILVAASGAIAFIRHEFQTAVNCYSAVSLAMSRHPLDRWVSEAMILRASRLAGRTWAPAEPGEQERFESRSVCLEGDERVPLPSSSYAAPARLVLEIAALRSALELGATGGTPDPHALLETAAARGYVSIEAMALAALAARSAADGDWTSVKRQLIKAWKKWSTSCDAVVAVDLFAFKNPGCSTVLRQSPELVEAIVAWVRENYPFHALAKIPSKAAQTLVSRNLLATGDAVEPLIGDASQFYVDPVLTAITMLVDPRHRAGLAERIAAELT